MTIYSELANILYGDETPYCSTDLAYVDTGYPHTNLVSEFISHLFKMKAPVFVLECGSMLGGSAILMGNLLKQLENDASIVCVDPFTGDVNMWEWEQPDRINNRWRFLRLENGLPTIYKRFLANCVNADLSRTILPINCTSIVGMRLIQRLYSKGLISKLPDYIYLDSAHEQGETLIELRTAWNTLPSKGILFGDDWSWPAVRSDVLVLAEEIKESSDNEFVNQLAGMLGGQVNGNIFLYKGQWLLMKK